jgi:hypothetical protein
VGAEVVEDWEGVVPDEEGVDFVQVSQAGFVALRLAQDLQTQPHQFFLLQLNGSLFGWLFVLIV